MAMPGRKPWHPITARPRRHTTIQVLQVIETRWVRPIGPRATCNNQATSAPLSPGTIRRTQRHRSNKPLGGETQLPSCPYTTYAARGERNNSHMSPNTTTSKILQGGRVGASPWSPCSKRVDLPINTQILGVQSERPDLITLSRLILLDDLITNVHK